MIELQDLLSATGGKLIGEAQVAEFPAFAFDSRRTEPGQLFVAVQTPTGDGHDYIEEAIERGARGVLCQQGRGYPVSTVIVSNTQQALLDYARFILRKYRPAVIGVTGSNGKSTTKEAVAAVLAEKYPVFKNPGSFNGRYGLPIALGQFEAVHKMAVLEMACDSFGEIAELSALARPAVGVVTSVSATHLAAFGTVENVALEKGYLVESLPASGTAILNIDDLRVAKMMERTQAKVITYAIHQLADLRATDIICTPSETRFSVHYQGQLFPATIKLIGEHQIYTILAAVAVGLVYKIPIKDSLKALSALLPLPGRLNPLSGKANSLILDDSFNASPASVRAAVDVLTALGQNGGQKIAILAEMADLGEARLSAHAEIGYYLANKVDRLITLGEGGQLIGQTAIEAGLTSEKVDITFTPADTVSAVQPYLQAGATVLVKGSAEARMERVIINLLANPTKDKLKLARATSGWEKVRLGLPTRPTWIELDLEALRINVQTLAKLAHPAKLMAVLKADAYGHGAIKTADIALRNGAEWLGVATLGEALTLRRAGINAPILVLGYLPAWQAVDAIRHQIRATVFTTEVLQAFAQASTRLRKPAYVHIKVDTGMGRLGLLPEDALDFIKNANLPGVKVEGLFSHFGRADEADLASARKQHATFAEIIANLERQNLRPPLVHCANTAGLLNLPSARFDMVRTGIGLYGLSPSSNTRLPAEMRPVLSFKTTVGQVKTLPSGSTIGYGGTYITQGQETIAIIPVGYADGFRRGPETWGEVLVKGKRAPLVGRVSMDQAAINVSDIPGVRQGDEVVLIGRQGSETISAEVVAANLGTINYEVVSQILARVPRMG